MAEKKTPKKKRPPREKQPGLKPWVITLLSLSFVLLAGFFAWLQLHNYEQGVLDVYANQQDGYVQLVLEQIHLVEKRGGTEDQIKEILATLDASTNQYWTLSKQSSLIFVKDVMETNRYQGFTTASYYQAISARDFVSALQRDQVAHETIQIGDHPYIASGVLFYFRGTPYRVCLLTNANTILDHNAYLTAKINLTTLALVVLATFAIAIEFLSYLTDKYRKLYFTAAKNNESLLRQMEKLNDALHKEELYDARRTAYTARALPTIWEKLDNKEPWPLTFLILQCRGEEAQLQFMQFTQFQMNKKILRVFLDSDHILLILLRVDSLELGAVKENIRIPGVLLSGERTLEARPEQPLAECFNSFMERTLEDEKQTPMQI